MIVGISSDMLFPVSEQVFLYRHIPNSRLRLIDSPFGHDGFLVEYDKRMRSLKAVRERLDIAQRGKSGGDGIFGQAADPAGRKRPRGTG